MVNSLKIIMINQKTQLILTTLKSGLLQLYGNRLIKVILFGSEARKTAHENSDIDVLIVLKGEVNIGTEIDKTSKFISELSLNYDRVISRLFMSEEYFINYQSALLRNIRSEGIVLGS